MGGLFSLCCPCMPGQRAPQREPHNDAKKDRESIRYPLLRVVFENMDRESRGSVTCTSVAEFGQYVGNRHWDEKSVEAMFRGLDSSHDGHVHLEEFQRVCFDHTSHHSNERFKAMLQGFIEVGRLLEDRRRLIEQVYYKIDVDENGVVDRENMMDFGRFMNQNFDEVKLNRLMDQMDLDGDGLISFEEFLAYFAKLSKPVSDVNFNKGIKKYLQYSPGKGGGVAPTLAFLQSSTKVG